VSLGLYEEIDKLSKKAPAEPITDLVLNQINDIIRETKQLAETDPYVQRLNEFVPAGDNPQHRDAVVVLRQVRQGLERFRKELDSILELLGARITEAKGIHLALRLHLEDNGIVEKKELEEYGVSISQPWMTGSWPNEYFDFNRLDDIDIPTYFGEAK
jgi:hypothetical protein